MFHLFLYPFCFICLLFLFALFLCEWLGLPEPLVCVAVWHYLLEHHQLTNGFITERYYFFLSQSRYLPTKLSLAKNQEMIPSPSGTKCLRDQFCPGPVQTTGTSVSAWISWQCPAPQTTFHCLPSSYALQFLPAPVLWCSLSLEWSDAVVLSNAYPLIFVIGYESLHQLPFGAKGSFFDQNWGER